jgi:TMEM175 potassium channel family protein
MSFLTLGVFWVGQQTQINHLRRSNRDFTWIQLVFLLFVVLMPFSTALVADYITYQLAIVVYWLNIALLGAILSVGLSYARRARLLKDHVTAATFAVMERRILVYQALYVVGALLSFASTYASIGFIIAVQLNAAITPRFWILDRF